MTPGELAHPEIAYHDANGRPLIGPCHVPGCPYQSLPGGGDAHARQHPRRVFYIRPYVYRGREGFSIRSRNLNGAIGWPIGIFVEGRDNADMLRAAMTAKEAGRITEDELSAYERLAFGMEV